MRWCLAFGRQVQDKAHCIRKTRRVASTARGKVRQARMLCSLASSTPACLLRMLATRGQSKMVDCFRHVHGDDAAGWFSYWSVRAGNLPWNRGDSPSVLPLFLRMACARALASGGKMSVGKLDGNRYQGEARGRSDVMFAVMFVTFVVCDRALKGAH